MDFNGSTTVITNTTATLYSSSFTMMAWLYLDAYAAIGFGRILLMDEADVGVQFNIRTATKAFSLQAPFSTTAGVWRAPTDSVLDSRWVCVAVTYIHGSTSDDPVFYICDTASAHQLTLATMTELTAPVGTPSTPATGYSIGDRAALARPIDGAMNHIKVWNRILTLGELNTAMLQVSKNGTGLRFWWPGYEVSGAEWSGNVLNGTVSNGALRNGPPTAAPWGDFAGYRGNYKLVGVGEDDWQPSKGGWFS